MDGHAEYIAGWIDTTVHQFLVEMDRPSVGMRYALITSLDSNPDVAAIAGVSKHLADLEGKFQPVGRGILMATSDLLATEYQSRMFFGFDEVWFFPHANITSKPEDLSITAPCSIGPEQIRRSAEWLTTNKCSLGLGDGLGMNYCLRIKGAAKHILRAMNGARSGSLDGRESA